MGYANYLNHAGRECGYGVSATCDHPGCNTKIDRGFNFLCGTQDAIFGGGVGCGKYFCEEHHGFVGVIKDRQCVSLCDACKVDPAVLVMLVDEDKDEGMED